MKKILTISILSIITALSSFSQGKITVIGSSSQQISPTITKISIDLSSEKLSYGAALEQLFSKSNSIGQTLKELGFEEKEILTSSFTIQKQYKYDKGAQSSDGYIANQQMIVQIENNNKKLIKIINKLTTDTANPEISLSFDTDIISKNKVKESLLQAAVADAQQKAALMANQAGYRVTAIEEIVYGRTPYSPNPAPYRMMGDMDMKFENELNSLNPGNLNFSIEIQMTVQIEK